MLALAVLEDSADALDSQIFRPLADNNRLISVLGTTEIEPFECWIGGYFNRDINPIELAAPNGKRVDEVLEELHTIDALPTCGITKNISLMARLPTHAITKFEAISSEEKKNHLGLGDIDVALRYSFLTRDSARVKVLTLPLVPYFVIPNAGTIKLAGEEVDFLGEPSFAAGLKFVWDWHINPDHYMAVNLTYHHREKEDSF